MSRKNRIQTVLLTTRSACRDAVEQFINRKTILAAVILCDDWCSEMPVVITTERTLVEDRKVAALTAPVAVKPSSVPSVPVLTDAGHALIWLRTHAVDRLVADDIASAAPLMPAFLGEAERMGITIWLSDGARNSIRTDSLHGIGKTKSASKQPVFIYALQKQGRFSLFLKRTMDIVLSSVGLLFSVPIIALVAIPLLIESPGPLFFKQKRIGKNGRVFTLYKLRSMYRDAEQRKSELMAQNQMQGYMFKVQNDPRITKVGRFIRKTSIDELPQLLNVLKGDMSLIGTRPPLVDEFNKYENHHKRRLAMKPGITGLWQVSGRSNITDFEEVVALDCQYIDHFNFFFDIRILFKTAKVVLCGTGAE